MKNEFLILYFVGLLMFFAVPFSWGQTHYTISSPNQRHSIQYLCLYESSQSIIWIGTNYGGFYFDGHEFVSPKLSSIMTDEEITSIGEDEKGNILFGAKSGRLFLNRQGKVEELLLADGHPNAPITGIERNKGQLWISTYGDGVFIKEDNKVYNISTNDGLLSNAIYCMAIQNNEIWVGSDAGINIVSLQNGIKRIHSITKQSGLLDEIVLSIHFGSDSLAKVGYFNNGLSSIDPKTYNVIHLKSGGQFSMINSIDANDNQIYVSSQEGVFEVLNNHIEKRQLKKQVKKIAPSADQILLDSERNIWLLNKVKGASKISTILQYHPLSLGSIQAIEIKNEELLLGSNTGLFKIDHVERIDKASAYFSDSKNVISLYVDEWKNIWVGTFGEGLFCFDRNDQLRFHLTSIDGLAENSILDIEKTGDHLTLGTLGGISKIYYDESLDQSKLKIKNTGYQEGLGTNYVYNVANKGNGNIWIGMDGQGVNYLEQEKILAVQIDQIELPLTAFNIDVNDAGKTLVGTSDQGLLIIEDNIMKAYSSWLNTYESEIYGIKHDESQNTYVISDQAIYILPQGEEYFAKYHFDIVQTGFEPNLNAHYIDAYNRLWVGGHSGVMQVEFDPQPLRINPITQILDVVLFEEPIDTTIKKDFKYNENYLVFNFLGIWYHQSERITYEYRLFGLDYEWIKTDEPSATFHHIPSGDYKFQVRSSITGDFSEAEIQVFSFSVRSPFWRKPAFLIGLFLIMGFLFWMLLKTREKRIAENEAISRERVESQYQALKSQINPHFLFNSFNTLIGTIENDPNAAITYVEKLSDFYRSILKYREKNLIPLSEELFLVENYVSLLRERFGEGIELEINIHNSEVLIAPLSLQMLVENAVKHNIVSFEEPLKLLIGMDDDLYIWVKNNLQKKTQIEPTTRYGLNNLRNRYKLLSENPVLTKETKTEFVVYIPILKKSV